MNNLPPPGFRFHPTDEELITYYLSPKVADISFTSKAIVDVDINKCEPWDLPAKASMGEKVWYFFMVKDRKYPTGLRTNRATEAGYWKTTGNDKEIYREGVLVGMKKTLVFYLGRAPKGEKSNWVMHEYRLETNPAKEEWVVCRVFKKNANVKKQQKSSSSSQLSPCDTNISIANEFSEIGNSSNYTINNDHSINMNMMDLTTLPSLPSWPSNLLSSNLTMNSLLYKALQFRGSYDNQLRDGFPNGTTTSTRFSSSFLTPHQLGSGFQISSFCDSTVPQPQQEQPFDLDSIW